VSIMGIDYGSRRIGIAISDPSGTMALPLTTIEVRDDHSPLEKIKHLVKDYQISAVVVGLPYNMDGTLSESGKAVMLWSERLGEILNLPVILWDERLTTFEAHDVLNSLNVKVKKRRRMVDKIAASLILKEYLHSRTA